MSVIPEHGGDSERERSASSTPSRPRPERPPTPALRQDSSQAKATPLAVVTRPLPPGIVSLVVSILGALCATYRIVHLSKMTVKGFHPDAVAEISGWPYLVLVAAMYLLIALGGILGVLAVVKNFRDARKVWRGALGAVIALGSLIMTLAW